MVAATDRRPARLKALGLLGVGLAGLAGCSTDGSSSTDGVGVLADIPAAVQAVEQARGGPQRFFEVTATERLVNVFVAAADDTVAVPYVYRNGDLEPPAPEISGVSGNSFTADAIDFEPDSVLSGIEEQLPSATIDAFSIEGGPGGFVRYVVAARSQQGGVLDIVVAPAGAVIEVNPR